jgi:hypothetical protein
MQKNPFTLVQPWMNQILHAIKKDIKTDHLSADKIFYKTHFGSRPMNKLPLEEIFAVYEKEILGGNEQIVEWAVNRWVFKNGDLYQHFAKRLSEINPEFSEITELSEAQAEQVLEGAQVFGALNVYLFARINGVVFPEATFKRLEAAAVSEQESEKAIQEKESAQESLERELDRYKREASRMKEKYDDKLAGVQRKYQTDTEALKKQIRSLQQRLDKQT